MSSPEPDVSISDDLSPELFIVEDDRIIINSRSFAQLVKAAQKRLAEIHIETEMEPSREVLATRTPPPIPPPPPIIHVEVGL
jgi:hypothetical protein